MNDRERWLVYLLRLGGGLMLAAFGAIWLPEEWMASQHRYLGLGAFPASPIVDYLTRSISALYAMHGGLLLVVASQPRRLRPVVVYLGASNIVLGLLLLGIDLHAGMPGWWTVGEGPFVTLTGFLILWLVRPVATE